MGAFVYNNINAVLYGVLFTLSSVFVIDRYMSGLTSGKMTLIISHHSQLIAAKIMEEAGRGVTKLYGQGMYSREDKDVLLCACSRIQLQGICQILARHDEDAIMIVLDFNEVRGRGFLLYVE